MSLLHAPHLHCTNPDSVLHFSEFSRFRFILFFFSSERRTKQPWNEKILYCTINALKRKKCFFCINICWVHCFQFTSLTYLSFFFLSSVLHHSFHPHSNEVPWRKKYSIWDGNKWKRKIWNHLRHKICVCAKRCLNDGAAISLWCIRKGNWSASSNSHTF